MAIVTRSATYIVVSSTIDGLDDHGTVDLVYDEATPYTVRLEFAVCEDGDEVAWTFARDLLAQGLTESAGLHDVYCWSNGIWFYIALGGANGKAVLKVFTAVIQQFLRATTYLVAYGDERVDFDAELAALLSGGAR